MFCHTEESPLKITNYHSVSPVKKDIALRKSNEQSGNRGESRKDKGRFFDRGFD